MKVHTLRDIQLAFAAEVFGSTPTGLPTVIRANGVTGARRLQVYRNNVFISLMEALQAVYPVIHKLVGDGFFRQIARAYIRRYPSHSGNLHDFGHRFAQFLGTFPGVRSLHYLPDVARLEWAYHRVFHAADAVALAPARLAAIPAEQYATLVFHLHPAGHLLSSPYPILRIWQVNQDDYEGEERVDLNEGEVKLLVIRQGLDTKIQTLSHGQFMFLQAFKQGRPFAQACERALTAEPQMNLPAYLQTLIINGTIVEVSNDQRSQFFNKHPIAAGGRECRYATN
jgi:hypothetical protein